MTTSPKKIAAVVAYSSKSRAIGRNGDLPWGSSTLKKDLKYFKKLTSETKDSNKRNAVIMGRKTWDSIPEKFKPLTGRFNVILSKTLKQSPRPDVLLGDDLKQILKDLESNNDIESIFVVGGGDVYSEALKEKVLDEVYATEVFAEFDNCDVFFPILSKNEFTGPEIIDFSSENQQEEKIPFHFTKFTRKEIPGKKRTLEESSSVMVATDSSTNLEEYQYLNLVREILDKGFVKGDRTGTGTKSVLVEQ